MNPGISHQLQPKRTTSKPGGTPRRWSNECFDDSLGGWIPPPLSTLYCWTMKHSKNSHAYSISLSTYAMQNTHAWYNLADIFLSIYLSIYLSIDRSIHLISSHLISPHLTLPYLTLIQSNLIQSNRYIYLYIFICANNSPIILQGTILLCKMRNSWNSWLQKQVSCQHFAVVTPWVRLGMDLDDVTTNRCFFSASTRGILGWHNLL